MRRGGGDETWLDAREKRINEMRQEEKTCQVKMIQEKQNEAMKNI